MQQQGLKTRRKDIVLLVNIKNVYLNEGRFYQTYKNVSGHANRQQYRKDI